MSTGTVKWFNDAKGYGFLRTEETDADVFVHYSAINVEGFKSLSPGETVQFDLVQGDKGYRAMNVNRAEA